MTTQFQPPPPPGAEVPGAFEPAETSGPRPMSAAAVAGFVCSLVFCIPFLAPLLGLIFGLVGIVRTSGGRRRGRGLAIAALPIALLFGAGHTWVAVAAFNWFQSMKALADGVQVALRASGPRVPEAAADLYQLSSKRFRVQVSEEQFQNWMAGVVKEHGQLQAIGLAQTPFEQVGPDQFVCRQVGRFVNGEAVIEVICAFDGEAGLRFDDIRIDGDSPLPD